MMYLIREENTINNYEDDVDLSQIENAINNLRREVSKQHSITRNELNYQINRINEGLLRIKDSIDARNKIEQRKLNLSIKQANRQAIKEELRSLKCSSSREFYELAREIVYFYNSIKA